MNIDSIRFLGKSEIKILETRAAYAYQTPISIMYYVYNLYKLHRPEFVYGDCFLGGQKNKYSIPLL